MRRVGISRPGNRRRRRTRTCVSEHSVSARHRARVRTRRASVLTRNFAVYGACVVAVGRGGATYGKVVCGRGAHAHGGDLQCTHRGNAR